MSPLKALLCTYELSYWRHSCTVIFVFFSASSCKKTTKNGAAVTSLKAFVCSNNFKNGTWKCHIHDGHVWAQSKGSLQCSLKQTELLLNGCFPRCVQTSQLKTVGYYHTPFHIIFWNGMTKRSWNFNEEFWPTSPKVQKLIGGRFNSLRTVSSNWKENGIIANLWKGNNRCVTAWRLPKITNKILHRVKFSTNTYNSFWSTLPKRANWRVSQPSNSFIQLKRKWVWLST